MPLTMEWSFWWCEEESPRNISIWRGNVTAAIFSLLSLTICRRVDKWVSPEWHRTMGFCDRSIPLRYPSVSGFLQDPGGRKLTQNPGVIRGYGMKSLGSEYLDNAIEEYRELAVVGITSSLNIFIVHSTYQYHTHSFIYNIFNLNNTSC